ncbi:MAG: SH3 domain-containing protein [Rhodoferax sp.]|nr:SH3 domain-containing protein [Rhodoferax sp.]
MKPLRILLLSAIALSTTLVQAQTENTIQTKRAAELRQSPDDKSASVASLPAQTQLTKTTLRVGPWIQVKTATAQTGWVHMFDVSATGNAQAPTSNAATGALRGLTNFFSGGSSQRPVTTATSTVGIRGLGAEDIANATPNLAALTQVEALRQDAAQARRFASDAPLSPHQVDNLPEPAPPAPNNAQNNTGGLP